MTRHILLLLLATAFLLSGCGSCRYLIEDEPLLLHYRCEPDREHLAGLAQGYGEIIRQNQEDEAVSQPGLFADYAASLALLGFREESSRWFNREAALYPNAAPYVAALKRLLILEYASDTSTDAQVVDLSAFDFSAPADELSLQAAPAPKLTPQEKKALAKEKEKAKKEKAKAKKQAAKEKAKAKKESERQKAKDRKAADKAKAQAQKEAEAAKVQAAKEKALAKKAEQEAKEQAKKQAEAAKKQAAKEKAIAKKAEQEAKEQAKKEAEQAKKQAEKEKAQAKKAEQEAKDQAKKEAEKAKKEAEKQAEQAKESEE